MTKDSALAKLSTELIPIIEKEVRDPMVADHLRWRILKLIEEMIDANGRSLLSND